MTIRDFDVWCKAFLEIDALASIDDSVNGIQVGGGGDSILGKVAFAVDASHESIRRAAEAGAQLLFVHHGLFWGGKVRVVGNLRGRLKLLLDADLALYACHLPLDRHPEVGNNACIARALGLEDLEPFARYHGVTIGCKGVFSRPVSLDDALARLGPAASGPRCIVPSGPAAIRSAGIVSGGGAMEALQALSEGLDLYITGEPSHSVYNDLVEGRMHFAALGHYATETFGVKAVAERLALEKGIETLFIDLPTGL
jgi:dinuclear metal center YbgI/SA1388 family protein